MDGSAEHIIASTIVCIGASGGQGLLDAIELLSCIPAHSPAVFMFTLHLAPTAKSELRAVLQRNSAMPIKIATAFERLRPGCCYIGEPGLHLTVASGQRARLIRDPTNVYRNRTIDALFRSTGYHGRLASIGVLLSGSLSDGSRGLQAIIEAGGQAFIRSPDPHHEGDMPRNALAYIKRAWVGSPAALAERLNAQLQGPWWENSCEEPTPHHG